MAKSWCLAAQDYDRKYKHLEHRLVAQPLEEEARMDMQVFLINPALAEPLPDYQLDGLLEPPATRGRRARNDAATAASSGAASSSAVAAPLADRPG